MPVIEYRLLERSPFGLSLDVNMVVDVVGAVAVVAVAPGAVAELHLRVGQVGLAAHGALVQVLGLVLVWRRGS